MNSECDAFVGAVVYGYHLAPNGQELTIDTAVGRIEFAGIEAINLYIPAFPRDETVEIRSIVEYILESNLLSSEEIARLFGRGAASDGVCAVIGPQYIRLVFPDRRGRLLMKRGWHLCATAFDIVLVCHNVRFLRNGESCAPDDVS